MLKVYVALYLMNNIVASIGPWPGATLEEALKNCQSQEPMSRANIDKAFADPKKVEAMRKETPGLERKDVDWKCITSETKPFIKDSVKMPRTE